MPQSLIPANWDHFPEPIRQRLGSLVGRQRAMEHEGHLLLIAHDVPEAEENSRRGILFWRDTAGSWKGSHGGMGIEAIQEHLNHFSEKIEAMDVAEQRAQKADDYLPLLDGLAPIARTIRHLLDALEEARKLVPNARELIDFRDRAYELSRQADLLYEDVKNGLEIALVRRADEQAQAAHRMMVASHRLNMMAALFFPFATLGAVFGTTLTDNWSWSHTPWPFEAFLAANALAGLIMVIYVSRKA